MKLSTALAQEIVQNIKDVLHKEINFMNEEGIIIASTDPARLQHRHGGAIIAIQTKQPVTIRNDHQYEGTRKGINVPVFFDEHVIGVIGITGEEKDVLSYGQILQKMTQILIRDAYNRDIRNQKRISERLWIEQLIQSENVEKLILPFDSSTHCSYRFVYVHLESTLQEEEIERIHRLIESKPYDVLVCKKAIYSKEWILLVVDDHRSLLEDLFMLLQQFGPFIWGIGTSCTSLSDLSISYSQARQAAKWGKQLPHDDLVYYEKSELGMILPDIEKQNRSSFLNTVFHDLSNEQIAHLIDTLHLFEQTNGSLKQASLIGSMHKNTFQYKLLQIKEMTGYDPRKYHDFAILKSAVILYQLQDQEAAAVV